MAEDAFIDFIVTVVQDRPLAAEFRSEPNAVLDRFPLSEVEKKILRRGRFRKGVIDFIIDRGDVERDVG